MKTESELLDSLARYCSQAERCVDDVRKKIKSAALTGDRTVDMETPANDAEKWIIGRLIAEKFIDERRFCRSFVNDKLKFNRWGRIKIGHELKKKNIKPEIYSEAIDSIEEDEYISILSDLLKSKKRSIKGRSAQDVSRKLYRFASSRGFESSLIIKTLKDIFGNIDCENYYE
ncbi:MAG: RecX family transcriptional regulator [Tannerella sp.]|jgi:regulatory protein|nr:RecX family transcriptional regulator [Tannerella sp.]